MKKTGLILFIFFSAFLLRLFLTPLGFHVDILTNAYWGRWIYEHGPMGFYENNIWILSWPTQPPLISLIYGFTNYLFDQILKFLVSTSWLWGYQFVIWFGHTRYPGLDLFLGHLITIKLLPILADLVIGLAIYFVAKRKGNKKALLWSSLYLFSPFSWYLSSLWGQYDQIGFLFLFLAFLSLYARILWLSPMLFTLSFAIKPTSLVFLPLFVFVLVKQKPKMKEFVLGAFLAIFVLVWSTSVFTHQNIFLFAKNTLIRIIFFKSEFRVSTNAFNFWHILIGNKALSDNSPFLFIPAKVWGWAAFLFLNLYAMKVCKKLNLKKVFYALFVIGAGSWLFVTNMLDRYFFAGTVFGLLLCVYYPRLLKYWLVLSLLFWLNLYNQWWFPEKLQFLKFLLEWQAGFLTRIISLANVVLFFLFVKYINSRFWKELDKS